MDMSEFLFLAAHSSKIKERVVPLLDLTLGGYNHSGIHDIS